jgi:cytochrome P450
MREYGDVVRLPVGLPGLGFDLLLAARDAETGEAMDTQQIRDEALVFLLAGHETTSTALTFALQLLGGHVDEQERAAQEVGDVLGGRPQRSKTCPRWTGRGWC